MKAAALLAIVLTACGGSQPPPPPVSNTAPITPVDAAVDAEPKGMAGVLAKMTRFSDDICTCSDRPCVNRVTDEMTRWGQEMAKSMDRNADKPSEADMKQMTVITERMAKCMTATLMQGTGSGTTP
jgi:hypothetical protein